MITAKESLKEYIRNQKNIEKFCSSLEISRQTIYNLLGGDTISSDTVAKLLNVTGFEFEKAFEIKE